MNYISETKVTAIYDEQYFNVLLDLIAKTRIRFYCSLFIIDSTPVKADPVVQIMFKLKELSWKGVDVRLLIGGSRDNFEIASRSLQARMFATSIGLKCIWTTNLQAMKGSHEKYIVADTKVLSGSHNWSEGSMTNQIQDSVMIESIALSNYLAFKFEKNWNAYLKNLNNDID